MSVPDMLAPAVSMSVANQDKMILLCLHTSGRKRVLVELSCLGMTDRTSGKVSPTPASSLPAVSKETVLIFPL